MTENLPKYGEPTDWHTVDSVRTPSEPGEPAPWEDAEHIPTASLNDVLNVAREQVLEFAPALPPEIVEAGKCPASYRVAHLMQARNLWNATEPDRSAYGDDGFSIPARPLDWIVRQMLRPKTPIPVAL